MTFEALGGTFGMEADVAVCLVEVVLGVLTRDQEVRVTRAARLTEVNGQDTLTEDKKEEERFDQVHTARHAKWVLEISDAYTEK